MLLVLRYRRTLIQIYSKSSSSKSISSTILLMCETTKRCKEYSKNNTSILFFIWRRNPLFEKVTQILFTHIPSTRSGQSMCWNASGATHQYIPRLSLPPIKYIKTKNRLNHTKKPIAWAEMIRTVQVKRPLI